MKIFIILICQIIKVFTVGFSNNVSQCSLKILKTTVSYNLLKFETKIKESRNVFIEILQQLKNVLNWQIPSEISEVFQCPIKLARR